VAFQLSGLSAMAVAVEVAEVVAEIVTAATTVLAAVEGL
jgi:hypothetical protein